MTYKHQAVNDLAFILQAPVIYQDMPIAMFWLPDWTQKLKALDLNPQALDSKLNQCKSHFLGSYFETLFSFAINNYSSFDVIFEHEQLISPVRTLGEIDALVRTQDGQLHQLEVAIKFYLESNRELGYWIGPNKQDSFIKKYDRAKSHQLKVLDLPDAQNLLQQYDLVEPIQRHLLMFGILFNQITKAEDLKLFQCSDVGLRVKINEKINPLAKTGYWISEANLSWLETSFVFAQELFKPYWISDPIDQVVNAIKLSEFSLWERDISSKFKADERPRHFLLSWKKSDTISGSTRIFVVPSNW